MTVVKLLKSVTDCRGVQKLRDVIYEQLLTTLHCVSEELTLILVCRVSFSEMRRNEKLDVATGP